jgi:arylsulfatase A-like enzyme
MHVAILALGFVLSAAERVNAAATPTHPNIVFIISDDQRWDALGAAGNSTVHTPVLDRLAAHGVWFRQSTIFVSQCSPCRSTLLTGLPPHRHRWYSNQYQHPDVRQSDGFRGLPMLPSLLRDAGYRTVMIGKWHPRPDPWNCGFTDVRIWMPGGGGPFLDPQLAEGPSRTLREMKGYTQEIFANDAVAFLKSEAATRQPFFLWLSFTAPHLPHEPTPERIDTLYKGKTVAELLPPGFPRNVTSAPWKIYNQAVTHLDEQVGNVLTALEEQKLDDSTIVIFLGDNGYMMYERGWNGKVIPYEGSVRVPLIIRAPGVATIKGANDAPVSSIDLPPTMLRLAGVTPPATWPGRDLGPLLRGASDHGISEAFCEWADNQSPQFGALGYRLVRTPAYKLIVWEKPEKPSELYDLVNDPHETNNRLDDPALAAVRADLRTRLKAWLEKTDDPARAWAP